MNEPQEIPSTPSNSQAFLYWRIGLLLLCAAAVAAALYFNRLGVDVEPDSGVMVSAGLRLAHGEGTSIPNFIGAPKPMTWFPPLVSWLVALCERMGVHYRAAFGIINALAWGLLVGWTGLLATHRARGGLLAGLCAAGVVATSSALCIVYGTIYSEPFFLLWMLGALAAIARWWERPQVRWAAIAGLCVAGALLTRYVGITLAATGGIVIIARPGLKWSRRFGYAALFSALSVFPLYAWLFCQTHVGHGDSPRQLAWHPISAYTLNEAVTTLSSFVIPWDFADSPLATRLITAGTVAIALLALRIWFRRSDGKTAREKLQSIPPLAWICMLFSVIYLAFLVVSISIADSDTPMDQRILAIIVPPGAIFAAWLGRAALPERGKKGARIFVALVVFIFFILQAMSLEVFIVSRKEVLWPAGSSSEMLDAIRALPPDALIYTPDPFGVYMLSRRRSEALPAPVASDATAAEAQKFQQQLSEMTEALAEKGGWVVYWEPLQSKDEVVDAETVKTHNGVAETIAIGDGKLLRIAPRAK